MPAMITWGEAAEKGRPRETKGVWGDTGAFGSAASWLALSQSRLLLAASAPRFPLRAYIAALLRSQTSG